MKRAVLYSRISTGDQHLGTQLLELRELAKQRGFEIVGEYTDVISGAKSKRPGLERLMADARRRRFDVLLVAAFDRIARNVRHFLEVLDELNHLGVEFISLRENIDTSGPLGRAMVVIVGAIAELERSLIVERVRAGMRRAKLEGRRIGRTPLQVDRAALLRDRQRGLSLNQLARAYKISKASVCRVLNEVKTPVSIASVATASPSVENQEFAPLQYERLKVVSGSTDCEPRLRPAPSDSARGPG
jgi:DNA invertase Pin-like site-specific DNA recombinase